MRDWLGVHYGDCRVLMKSWPSAVADACIVDPPYGDTSLKWDRQVKGWIPEAARVLKPASSIWLCGSLRFLVKMFGELEEAGFRYSQDIVWEKQNGTGFRNDRFRRVHEHVVLFYRGAWSEVYHDPQFTMDARATTARRKKRPTHMGNIEQGHYVSVDGGPRLMRSVLQIPNEHGRAVHPTQKPVALIKPLIQYSVPLGGIVIDPFIGSLTTGIAASECGRLWAGCELDEGAPLMHAERLYA